MLTLHEKLWVGRLDPERQAMSRYWFVVTDRGGTPHTAFRSRHGLYRWAAERGLIIEPELKKPSGGRIIGQYRTESHLHDADVFYSLKGIETRAMSNSDWVRAIITTDADGIRTVHTLNPNVRDREVFPYLETSDSMDPHVDDVDCVDGPDDTDRFGY